VPRWHKLIIEGIHFGWLAVWVLSPDWLSRKATFVRRLGEVAAPGEGSAGRAPTLHLTPWHFALQLRKITENLSQGNRKALG